MSTRLEGERPKSFREVKDCNKCGHATGRVFCKKYEFGMVPWEADNSTCDDWIPKPRPKRKKAK